jgi:hypothetical protein
VTVHVGDLAHEDVQSFTFFVEAKRLAASGLTNGSLATFYVRGIALGSCGAVWAADILRPPV